MLVVTICELLVKGSMIKLRQCECESVLKHEGEGGEGKCKL
jgi:hypothetical protein